jgi:hypothetical protein
VVVELMEDLIITVAQVVAEQVVLENLKVQ